MQMCASCANSCVHLTSEVGGITLGLLEKIKYSPVSMNCSVCGHLKINFITKSLQMKITKTNKTQRLYISLNLYTVEIARVLNTYNFLGC